MGKLKVLDPGFFTTIQDAGRKGYRKFGVPVGGAMDPFAVESANWLVGNKKGAPVLEMTLQGGTYLFLERAIIGLTGGIAPISLNDEQCPQYQTIHIEKGDTLKIGKITSGCRIYMSIYGQWELQEVMESYATCIQAGFGGIEGRALKKTDELTWSAPKKDPVSREVPKQLRPYFGSSFQIRIMEGPEWNWLPQEQQRRFLDTDFKVTSESNRMGIRMKSEVPFNMPEKEMTSAPVLPGIIQLPKSGHPIVLMNDAQSIGGYPRIAKVADADLWRIAQTWRPALVHFKRISRKEAIKLSAFQENILY